MLQEVASNNAFPEESPHGTKKLDIPPPLPLDPVVTVCWLPLNWLLEGCVWYLEGSSGYGSPVEYEPVVYEEL